MKLKFLSSIIYFALTHFCFAAPIQFSSSQHRLSATLPDGWEQVQGLTQQSVLKLARLGSGSQKARIALMLHDVPSGTYALDYDIWSMSDADMRTAIETNATSGITVLHVGRGAVDGLHMMWSKSRVEVPDGSTLWDFTYEGIRGSQYLTIRLTSVGDEVWFTANQALFAEFIRTLKLSTPAGSATDQAPAPAPLIPVSYTAFAQSDSDVSRPTVKITKSGDSFWMALGKSGGEQFLKVLGAVILISVVSALWSKFKSNKRND